MSKINYPIKVNQSQLGVYLDQINENQTVKYNIPLVRKYNLNEIDVDKLQKAVNTVLASSNVSKMYFKQEDGQILMYEDNNIKIDTSIIKIKEEDSSSLIKDFVKPFDLSKAPLFRSSILVSESNVYLLIDFHHLISDGTSMKIIFDNIDLAYLDKPLPIQESTLQVECLKEQETNYFEKLKENDKYFIDKFDGLNIDSNLPVDYLDNKVTSLCGLEKAYLDVDYSKLDNLAKENNVTKGNLLIAAFSYALAKITYQEESLFCTVCSGRQDNPKLQNTIGMFVKTFPYYQKFDENAPISKCFNDANNSMKESVKHSDASFIELAKQTGITTDILFTYQGRLYSKMENIYRKDSQSNIAFFVFNDNNKFHVEVEYRQSLYTKSNIKRLIKLYESILNGFITCKKLSEIKTITKEDEELINKFNKTELEIPLKENVLSLFKKQVELNPSSIAVVYKDKSITYSKLDELSSKISSYLISKGIKKGDFVSILLNRSIYMPICSLGVIKSGAIYQPLDSSYPQDRLNFMVNDCKAKILILDRELDNLITDFKGEKLYVDQIESLVNDKKEAKIDLQDNFIILYTSGTTGTPKGVLLKHLNILNFVTYFKDLFKLTKDSRYAAYASFGFDANMMDTYPILTSGGQLHILDEDIRLDLNAINQYFIDNKITDSFMTTQVGRQFGLFTTCKTLKHFAVGGEKLVPLNPPKDLEFYNIYGPTECTVFNTYYKVQKESNLLPIGKATPNTKIYVVDKNLNQVPINCSGELVISGLGVSSGYLNREDITSKTFIKNPFSTEKGYEKLYRTGDVVRYLEDGNLEFIGRKDSQVKIRGFRIELTEVEKIIREYKGIEDCTVVAFDSPSGGKFIAAYIVSSKKIDIEDLNNFIGEQKPPYMIPEFTIQIDKIPLNQNSKVNKRALPKPELKIEEDTTPLTDIQKEIASIVKDILNIEVTSSSTLLSRYGLTSISSIRLASILFKNYGIEFKNRELINSGSLKMIEDRIKLKNGNLDKKEVKENNNIRYTKLTFAQQGVYSDCVKNPSSTSYNIPFEVEIPSKFTSKNVEDSIKLVISKHPSLQVKFASKNDDVVEQEILDFKPNIKSLELNEKEYDELKHNFIKPFDLENEMMRFIICKVESKLYLLMDFHHLIMDGSSVDIFLNQLALALDNKEIEKEEYTYFEYGKDQKIEKEDEEFFANNMVVEEATRLIPDVYIKDLPSKEEMVSVETDLEKVNKFASKLNLTPASIYLAASYIASSRFTYEDSIGIATISSGRSNVKICNTLGMFVNTLPLTISIDSSLSCTDFIKQVGDNFNQTITHENYPFSLTATKYDFRPSISYAYQVGVINTYSTKYGQLKCNQIPLEVAKIPVSIFINQDENKHTTIDINYDSSLYSSSMMLNYAKAIKNAVEGLINLDKIKDISIVDKQQEKVLDSYNQEWDLGFDKNDTAVSLFKKNVKKHPSKLAACYKDKRYTYKELDELTDNLAKIIYKHVQKVDKDNPEPILGIISSRNENTFILPLAVLKAGCAYEPLDPSYPQKRLNYMVKDAAISLLIAEDDLVDVLNEYDGPTLLFSDLYKEEIPNITPKLPTPENRYIMLYTSGSTGLPKGVQIEHRNLIAYAYGTCKENYYTPDCVTAAYASFGFDVNMADTFCTLLNGGSLHLISEDIRMNLDQLASYFDDNGVTLCLLTTQVGVQFIQNHPKMKTLRYLTLGGEKLPSVDPSKLTYQLNNGYGPTENCCGVSLFPVKKWEANIPLGKPMKTIHGYILDKFNHRLPSGAAGEYCLSGPQVSRGYLNQEEKTKQAYQQCPFNEFRMYHTGDVVRYKDDGNVEFVGRKDGQVKIRGFRIETKEIEAVIRDFKGVKDTTVQAYSYPSGGKYLAAFIVFDGKLDVTKLNEFIKSKLPSYMVPTVSMQLDKIPLTVNQKVDKKALPEPKVASKEYKAPTNKVEEDIIKIISSILGIEKVSIDDDFFEIGGSSINAMKVVIAANKLGYQIVYKDVFDHGVVSDLANFIISISNIKVELVSKKEEKDSTSIYGINTKEIDDEGYNYSSINELLRKNTLDEFKSNKLNQIGDVLLVGSTGYLGNHVLIELLKDYSRTIYCLIRSKQRVTCESRLLEITHYYHGAKFDNQIKKQVKYIEKDATDSTCLDDFDIDNLTVINCAASVKHFAKDDSIEKTNVNTVDNLIKYCLKHNSILCHVSTQSVMGSSKQNMPDKNFKFTENVLYAGQIFNSNQYVHSKFTAEKHIYENILEKGLKAKVFRVGNLSPRQEDGIFQINYSSNSFMKSIEAYLALDMIPYSFLDQIVEFSPIDEVAKTIILLSKTPSNCICFMPSNNHRISIGDIVLSINKDIKLVEQEEFISNLNKALLDPNLVEKVSPLLVYQNTNKEDDLKTLGLDNLDNSYTTQILYRLGYRWPTSDKEYISKFSSKLKKLGFFTK